MAKSSSIPELQQSSNNDVLELSEDFERMIENVENMSLQLTCMAYDMVTLVTEVETCMSRLKEAVHRCRAAVSGDQEPEMDDCPDPTATPTLPQM
ncbi:synaptonemal complex central element protein 3 [Pagrus major]|uniref:synaptonemal complex central element protein 3 n=1 Tax=Pagrus major TaxID=143350 RepID=UPI003CC8D2FB